MSVALPMTSGLPATPAETDLVRHAARGDRAAFDEIYRSNAPGAWRLASAVAPDSRGAEVAVTEGFVRALRARRSASSALRASVLAGVYRIAIEQHRHGPVAPPRVAPEGERLVVTSFLALPERWRAAVWLTEVEGQDSAGVAAVLGVPLTSAAQLTQRGLLALGHRMRQAGQDLPATLGAALRPLAPALPTSLEAATVARWRRAVVTDPGTRLAPLTAWMGARAPRTLGATAAGVLALGLVGVGILTQASDVPGALAVNSPGAPGANGTLGAAGRSGDHTGSAFATGGSGSTVMTASGPVSTGNAALTASTGPSRSAGRTASRTGHATTADAGRTTSTAAHRSKTGATSGHTTRSGSTSGGTSSGSGASAGGGSTSGGSTGGGASGGGSTGGGVTTTTIGTTTVTTIGTTESPAVTVPGVAAVAAGTGGVTVTVGSSSSPAVGADICQDGVEISVLGVVVGSCPTTSTTSGTTTPTTAPPATTTTTAPSASSTSGSGSSGSGSSGSGSSGLGGLLGGLGL